MMEKPPINKVALEEIIKKINEAISKGAGVYDMGQTKKCFDIYFEVSQALVNDANKSKQVSEFWCVILTNALSLSASSNAGDWGTQRDPAWILRKAFEAIKYGALKRGAYKEEDCVRFFKRIKDDFNFLSHV